MCGCYLDSMTRCAQLLGADMQVNFVKVDYGCTAHIMAVAESMKNRIDHVRLQVCGGYVDSMTRCAQLLEQHVHADSVDVTCSCILYRTPVAELKL